MMMDTTNSDAAFWIAGYADYLRDVVGASESTRLRYLPTVRRFIAACSGPGVPDWTGLSVQLVTEFIRQEAAHKTGHGRATPASVTRSFLRFLAWRGVVAPSGLDRAIPAIRRAQHASLPPHLSAEQLARLLQCPAAPGPAAYRDRAILALLAGLGLRASEVAALELDDLDWRAGLLRLRPGKCRRERVLPLPQEIGAALAEYLRHGRPSHLDRRVFVTLTDPPRTFQAAAVTALVRRHLVRADIPLGRLSGAHMLRHTAASRMVNAGAGFKDVADVLGHRSLQTTGIYAKLDLEALADVALPWIGGAR
jgi:site-specific recombinase XerD